MPAGSSSRPLWQKLGLKPGTPTWIIDAPDGYFDRLADAPAGIDLAAAAPPYAFIQFFTRSAADLQKRLPGLKARMKRDGMLWISWPKKASREATDLTEDVVRNLALENGLVDVKVAAIDETWSGLKLVYRLADR